MFAATPDSVLVVDDDLETRELLAEVCRDEGIEVRTAATGKEALRLSLDQRFDVVLLDLHLPDVSGFDVCRELRRRDSRVVISMVTGSTSELDAVVCLELGADDYIVKPFHLRELVARVRAHLRRLHAFDQSVDRRDPSRSLQVGRLMLHEEERMATLDGQPLVLTRTEFDILKFLAEHPGWVLTREQLVSLVWGYDDEGTTRLLDAHIKNLRRKIEVDPHHPKMLLTVREIGYRLVETTAPLTT